MRCTGTAIGAKSEGNTKRETQRGICGKAAEDAVIAHKMLRKWQKRWAILAMHSQKTMLRAGKSGGEDFSQSRHAKTAKRKP